MGGILGARSLVAHRILILLGKGIRVLVHLLNHLIKLGVIWVLNLLSVLH